MNYNEGPCVIEHEGKEFSAQGAVVTSEYITAYCSNRPVGLNGEDETEQLNTWYDLTDWHGYVIGRIKFTSRWRTPRSHMSSYQFQAIAEVDWVRYTGRTNGFGMLFRGRRKACQR